MPVLGQLNHSLRILVLQDSEYLQRDNSASLAVPVMEMTAVVVNINNFFPQGNVSQQGHCI